MNRGFEAPCPEQSSFRLEVSSQKVMLAGMIAPKPKRRCFQFSLRTLLLVVTGWALMLSFWKTIPSPKLVYCIVYTLLLLGVFFTAAAVFDLFFRRRS